MKADYLEFKDKCIQMLTEIDFLNQVQMTKEEILSVLAGCRLEEAYDALFNPFGTGKLPEADAIL